MSNSKSGLDFSHIDSTIRLQDDLFRYFNGKWLAQSEIPEDRAADGAFVALRIKSETQVRDIIESATGSGEGQKIGDLYKSFMGTSRIQSLGISPIAKDLAAADKVQTLADFISTMSYLEARGTSGLFDAGIYPDQMDSTTNIVYLNQGGLSLPDEAYYREEEYAPIRQALLGHIEKMFALVGNSQGKELAVKILDLETQIAAHHWDQVKDRDATLTYNKRSRVELEKLSPGLDWGLYLSSGEIAAKAFENVVVRQPDFFTGVAKLLAAFERGSWVAWLKWQIISGSAPYLTDELVDENFAFYGTTLSGTPKLRERWKRATSLVEGSLGEAIGKLYVEKYFPPQAKARMQTLVANLIAAYRLSITDLAWMSPQTKKKAIEKLEKFTSKIGYPDKWRDYSALEITSGDLFGNLGRVTKFQRDYELAKIGAPVDRDEWHMSPQTVNAYYNPLMNEIVFPAGILQAPFFELGADDAVNYGGIGAVIGHEIGHGFDDQGSKYDGNGNLNNWWSDADRSEFEKRSSALIAQYNVLRPRETPEITVNGALTVGENIGDLGGLTIAYKAYQISLAGAKSPVMDELTGEQRLFLSWAQVWRGKVRPEESRRRIATDPHSPAEFRCNMIVSQLQEFYDAFGVTQKDAHWIDETSRVLIW